MSQLSSAKVPIFLINKNIVRLIHSTQSLCNSIDKLKAKQWVDCLKIDNIPSSMFFSKFSRSSGPGGQNVNKVNSKCTLIMYDFHQNKWIPQYVKDQLLQNPGFRYYTSKKDALVIQSDESRSSEDNKRLCLEKFVKMIKQLVYFPKDPDSKSIEKWVNVKKKSNEHRLQNKKFQKDKKLTRKKVLNYDF
ncbi:Pth4p SCDLUD_005039 [Saccharomycodes ludwigii]|uniref:Pth4p n=1 Tax=Saccharomycodes ludwigii TaxID=36035 RepID=UPI001E8A6411|nr:hypothetical protein SCDLUD_005039 [Saccharomycodes ludwigii]KAH3898715.1 hypothetical protein SCDLUD_005039 [Saccharomycodes ludwigii]